MHLALEFLPFDGDSMTLVAFICGEVKNLEEEGDHVAQLPAELFGFTFDPEKVTCPNCKELDRTVK